MVCWAFSLKILQFWNLELSRVICIILRTSKGSITIAILIYFKHISIKFLWNIPLMNFTTWQSGNEKVQLVWWNEWLSVVLHSCMLEHWYSLWIHSALTLEFPKCHNSMLSKWSAQALHPQVCNIVRLFYLLSWIVHMTNPFPPTNHHVCPHCL